MTFQLKYFYHLTCYENAVGILNDKYLTYGKGMERWEEDFISFADYLHYDLATFDFGDLCFEFKAQSLLGKNKIIPFNYKIMPEDFYLQDGYPAMPFWECEWVSKKTFFDLDDINCFIISTEAIKYLGNKRLNILRNLLNENNISHKTMDFNTLPKPNDQFFIDRYLQRIKYPNKIYARNVKP